MKLRCLLVDDEPPAHHVLESYIGKLDRLEVVGNCYSAIEAINYLHKNAVDILFLDINMPELTGMDMLKTLQNPPIVIMTTAYSEYALEGYEFGVFDYLMKPIRFERFLKTIHRILDLRKFDKVHSQQESVVPQNDLPEEHFFVKADGVQHKIKYDDLIYIESKGNFVQLHHTMKVLTAETLTNMDKKLRSFGFMRVHKSYIVDIAKVKAVQGNQLVLEHAKIPIGNSYRQAVLERLGL